MLMANNCFSQWKTAEANNIKGDIVITYEVIYDRELSPEEKQSAEFLNDIGIAFNKDIVVERRFGSKIAQNKNFTLYNYKTLKGYACTVAGDSKIAVQFNFKEPSVMVETAESAEPKIFSDYPCEKATVMINKVPKDIYYTKKIGLRYCRQFKIDGFLMEYPGYSKTLGYYTVRAKKITNAELPAAFYSLDDYKIHTEEDLKKQQQEHAEKISEIRLKNIGEKAVTFKDLSLKNEKIDTKKMLGDIIVYNFWFTTCGPCKAEIPKLNQLKEKYKDKNVHFIAIALDEDYQIIPFLKKSPIAYDIIPNGRWIAEKFGVSSYPTNIIVDKKGITQFYEVGYKSDILEKMSSSLDQYLEQ